MPTIVFKVDLATMNQFSSKQPYNQYEAVNFPFTRVTWFPDMLRNNRELRHGSTFSVQDEDAIYLLNNFTSGQYKFLDVVSITP